MRKLVNQEKGITEQNSLAELKRGMRRFEELTDGGARKYESLVKK